MEPNQHQPRVRSKEQKGGPPRGSEVGGREFGQVIEPTQAQMASGNEGLAENHQKKPKKDEMKRRKKSSRAAWPTTATSPAETVRASWRAPA